MDSKTWALTDDDCSQYAKKLPGREFALIQVFGPTSDTEEYIVLYDEIDVGALPLDELLDILNTYGYADEDDVRSQCGDDADQIMAECVFETTCLHDAQRLFKDKKYSKCEDFVKKYVAEHGGTA